MNILESINNWYNKNYLTEGTHYNSIAADMLVNNNLISNKEEAILFINDIQKQLFSHPKSWLMRYLKGVARMMIETKNINLNLEPIKDYISYAKNYHDNNKDFKSIDDYFINTLSYDDLIIKIKEYKEQLKQKDKEQLNNIKFNSPSQYTLIPIYSYEELNFKFGDTKTETASILNQLDATPIWEKTSTMNEYLT